MKNTSEQILSFAENELVQKESIRRAVLSEAPAKQKKPVAWTKILLPIAACLVLAFGMVFLIPSARAEILSWFQPASAGNYLAADPEDRDPIPALDAMITGPELNHTEIKVNYVADEPYWREIGENFSATLGETIYDGNDIYISVDFDGLSGYAVYEGSYCPDIPAGTPLWTLLAEKVDPEMVRHFRTDNADISPYLSGAMEQWNGPDNRLILTLDDGRQMHGGWMDLAKRPVDVAFSDAFHAEFGYPEYWDEEAAAALKERAWEHFKTNGARGIAVVYAPEVCEPNVSNVLFFPNDDGKTLADYIDEDGYLTLHARYCASIDHGEEQETKLDVDLGTVKVDMKSYKDLPHRSIGTPSEPTPLSGEAVFSGTGWNEDQAFHVTNYTADLDGVTLRVTYPGTVDLFGVHDLQIRVTMPDTWSDEMKKAFAEDLEFRIAVDDTLAIGSASSEKRNGDGSYTLHVDLLNCIPFDQINSMQTITLTPVITRFVAAEIYRVMPDGSEKLVKTVPIGPEGSFDSASLAPETPIHYQCDAVEHPEWEIVLPVN